MLRWTAGTKARAGRIARNTASLEPAPLRCGASPISHSATLLQLSNRQPAHSSTDTEAAHTSATKCTSGAVSSNSQLITGTTRDHCASPSPSSRQNGERSRADSPASAAASAAISPSLTGSSKTVTTAITDSGVEAQLLVNAALAARARVSSPFSMQHSDTAEGIGSSAIAITFAAERRQQQRHQQRAKRLRGERPHQHLKRSISSSSSGSVCSGGPTASRDGDKDERGRTPDRGGRRRQRRRRRCPVDCQSMQWALHHQNATTQEAAIFSTPDTASGRHTAATTVAGPSLSGGKPRELQRRDHIIICQDELSRGVEGEVGRLWQDAAASTALSLPLPPDCAFAEAPLAQGVFASSDAAFFPFPPVSTSAPDHCQRTEDSSFDDQPLQYTTTVEDSINQNCEGFHRTSSGGTACMYPPTGGLNDNFYGSQAPGLGHGASCSNANVAWSLPPVNMSGDASLFPLYRGNLAGGREEDGHRSFLHGSEWYSGGGGAAAFLFSPRDIGSEAGGDASYLPIQEVPANATCWASPTSGPHSPVPLFPFELIQPTSTDVFPCSSGVQSGLYTQGPTPRQVCRETHHYRTQQLQLQQRGEAVGRGGDATYMSSWEAPPTTSEFLNMTPGHARGRGGRARAAAPRQMSGVTERCRRFWDRCLKRTR